MKMNGAGNGISWMHRFATFAVVMTLLLIIFETLVTSNGLAIPHWPTSLADFREPRRADGIDYESGYRMVAATVSLVTLILALWLWGSKSPRYVKILSGIGVLAVASKAILDGVTILSSSSMAFSLSNALTTQILFCLTFCLALFTRTDWRWGGSRTPDICAPSLRQLLVFTTGTAFMQSILGAPFQHKGLIVVLHLVGGVVATMGALWALEMVFTKFSHVSGLKIPAVVLTEMMAVQLLLGIVTYSMELNARGTSKVMPGVVIMTATHAAVGALALATSLFVTFLAFRYVRRGLPRRERRVEPGPEV